jgi:hypothetical protein
MDIFNTKQYIIRNGDFASNGNKKLIYSLFALLLCIDDYINFNSTRCFNIMIGSSIIWTIIEFLLHITGTRIISQMYITNLWNNEKIKLPNYLGILLQGIQEGGMITTFGLYFAERLNEKIYIWLLHIFLFYMSSSMLYAPVIKTNNKSKRQINTLSSICLMCIITIYNMYCFYYNPIHRMSLIKMFFTMVYLSSIWTFISYYKQYRGIEISKNDIVQTSTHFDAFLILGYDVVFEIGIAYLTFYNLFLLDNTTNLI